ncbi:hypothetical protein DXU07_11720 [Bradyrhizobium elkanii]|jgi:hypothetical protein|nr:hypothetical protein [Bradyrhizobium elkanii]NWL72113.1 hypothetical protein [Bradyrhizobium elkanii]RYM28173.1 hypothetical protein EWH13_12830 [Bradyrhizobium elkanii]
MQRAKQASRKKRTTNAAVPALGLAGLTFSLAGSAYASAVPTGDVQHKPSFAPGHMTTLSEEELADVSLATFHLNLIDDESVGGRVLLARGCGGCRGCGGARACGGCRGCGGCRACRGCRCGVGCGGCGGCGVGWIGVGVPLVSCAGCCASWGRCRWC